MQTCFFSCRGCFRILLQSCCEIGANMFRTILKPPESCCKLVAKLLQALLQLVQNLLRAACFSAKYCCKFVQNLLKILLQMLLREARGKKRLLSSSAGSFSQLTLESYLRLLTLFQTCILIYSRIIN